MKPEEWNTMDSKPCHDHTKCQNGMDGGEIYFCQCCLRMFYGPCAGIVGLVGEGFSLFKGREAMCAVLTKVEPNVLTFVAMRLYGNVPSLDQEPIVVRLKRIQVDLAGRDGCVLGREFDAYHEKRIKQLAAAWMKHAEEYGRRHSNHWDPYGGAP